MQQAGPWARVVHPSPFGKLAPDSRRYYEKALLEAFEIAVETDDDREEEWAYEQCKAFYASAIAELDDLAPSFFEAMAWAGQQLARRGPA